MKRLVVCFLSGVASLAQAAPLNIPYGVTQVDVNGDGIPDIITRFRWDVLSAHSADIYTVTVTLPGKDGMPPGSYVVGLKDEPSRPLWASEGADCILTAYRFALNEHSMLELKEFKRDSGNPGFCDPTPVKITTYVLTDRRRASLGGTGLTPFYLDKVKETVTKESYQDLTPLLAK